MSAYSAYSDQQLAELLKAEDRVAYKEIFDRYWPLLYLHVNRMCREEDLAQDIVQDLFIWLFEKAAHSEINTSLSGFLYTAVRNRVLNAIKHKKLKNNYLVEIAVFADQMTYTVDESIHVKELAAVIEREIDLMPPKMREIFILSRKSHLSHKEIAAALNISEHTVSTQIQRALVRLRNNKELQYAITTILFKIIS